MSRNIVLFFGLLLLLIGCGAQNNPTNQDSGTASDTVATADEPEVEGIDEIPAIEEIPVIEENINELDESILPKTISIEIPDVLKQSAPKTTLDENNQSDEQNTTEANSTLLPSSDLGYEQLKEDIAKVEDVIKKAQINLIFLEKVMPEVLERCEGMLSCVFEEKRLAVVMDNETINSINTLMGDANLSSFDVNDTVQLGEIGFSKFDSNESYQYALTLEMLLSDTAKNSQVLNEYQSFKWSEDSSEVMTTYVYEDNETLTNIALHYLTDAQGKEVMHVYDTSDNKKASIKENTSLILVTDKDDNGSFNLTSNSILKSDNNVSDISRFSSNVKISDAGSLMLFSGSVLEENATVETGTTSELSCDSNLSCQENGDESNTSTEVKENTKLYELRITGGNLEEGDYVLLAPGSVLEGMSLLDIFDQSLGSFTVFEDKTQGALHSDAFLYMLSDLTIVAITSSQSTTGVFKSVPKEDYPSLRIVKY